MPERLIEANGVELCAESFGVAADPPILLMAGLGSSMLWWEEDFCRLLAAEGRFVIRYDQRDTGRSVTSAPGHPDYSGDDLVKDAVGVLDAHRIRSAHLVGVSAGAASAQLLALDSPGRVRSLVLISTSPAVSAGRPLPSPAPEFFRFLETAEVDWSGPESVIDYTVGYQRMLSGKRRPFDERAFRQLVRRDVERARDFAAAQNHDALSGDDDRRRGPLEEIAAPTLVIHGTADPMFPIGHGEAIAAAIPGAELLRLEGAGHGVDPADWEVLVRAIAAHTSN